MALFAEGFRKRQILKFDRHTLTPLKAVKDPLPPVFYASFLWDSEHVLSSGTEEILLWKFDARTRSFDILRRWDADQCYAALSPDGRYAVVGLRKDKLEVWDLRKPAAAVKTGAVVGEAANFEMYRGIAVDNSGLLVATAPLGNGEVCLWDVKTGKRPVSSLGASAIGRARRAVADGSHGRFLRRARQLGLCGHRVVARSGVSW